MHCSFYALQIFSACLVLLFIRCFHPEFPKMINDDILKWLPVLTIIDCIIVTVCDT